MYVEPVTELRRERKKQLTRHRIVRSAVGLFEEQGYDQTTVAQIAARADVDPKTFFNYFRSKDEVLFDDVEQHLDVLLAVIAERRMEESPGEVLARAVGAYAAHRRPTVPSRSSTELSAAARLALTTPALQAKGLYLLLDLQQRIAGALVESFPGQLDPVTGGGHDRRGDRRHPAGEPHRRPFGAVTGRAVGSRRPRARRRPARPAVGATARGKPGTHGREERLMTGRVRPLARAGR